MQRVWVDLPLSAAGRGTRPRSSWARRHQTERDEPEQRPLGATGRQLDADACDVLDYARTDLDEALSDCRELALGERAGLRDRGAHAMHQPECGGVKNKAHLIGGRAVTRHPIRRQLRFVQLDQVLHLPALAIDVLVKVLRRALERGDDVADVDLLAHVGRSCDRLQRAFKPSHDLARSVPAAGLVQEARKGAQLRLAAHRMMEAQIVGRLRHQGVEYGIAGKAKNVARIVVFRPLHGLDAAVVAVAAPHQVGLRPMFPQALRHMLDDGPHLGAVRGARRAQDGYHRRAARHVVDVHRREAALVVMRVPERKLLTAMRGTERVVDARISCLPGVTIMPA